MAANELWVVSQQTGALGSIASSPCCPSGSGWWGKTAVPRSWALQTWIEMAKYGTGTNAVQMSSTKPREPGKHVLGCCPADREQGFFKWPISTGVKWLSQLCDEAGAHLRAGTLNRLTWNTTVLQAADGVETARMLDCILGEITQTGPQTQGSKLKELLGPWNKLTHHSGHAGSFVNFSEPGEDPGLIDVCSSQSGGSGKSVLHGWEFRSSLATDARRSERKGATWKMWGDPIPVALMIEPECQTNRATHVRLAGVTLEGRAW